jgi:hypothetical protein
MGDFFKTGYGSKSFSLGHYRASCEGYLSGDLSVI